MGAIRKQDPVDIGFMLMMKYRSPIVQLSDILQDYMPHLTLAQANKRASQCRLPFPAFKIDGVKSPYFVHLTDLEAWLNRAAKQSKNDWVQMHN